MDKKVLEINQGWKFHYGECEEAFYKGWDDSNFVEVSLPHDWSVTMPFERINSSGTGYLSGGIGWYRLHFKLSKEYQGKHILLNFDGIYKNSQVWINSYNLGKHPNGYTPVRFDITEFVSFSEENVIAVKVVHNDLADSRWFTGSGIVRTATIEIEEMVHPKKDGIYLYTTAIGEGGAEFTIHHEAVNDTESVKEVTASFLLFDDKELVWTKDTSFVLSAKEEKSMTLDGTITGAKLWSVEHPNRYRLRVVYSCAGEEYICEEQSIGLRTAVFDADKGFFLNGEELKLKGVCVHHDAGALGAAVTPEVWRRRLLTLKECGCNAIRCSHNPHMPALYELCDELGFLMMDEAFDEWECPKNKWSTGHNVYPPKHQGYAEDFPEWHERDLRAMVRRDRKHPSVIMWSIGNEIDYPNDPYCHPSFETMTGNNDANKPKAERLYDPNKPNAERMIKIARELSAIVKDEDLSRPVTMALAFPELSAKLGVFEALDVAGYNYKEHLYEEDHKTYCKTPITGSENGHGYKAWLAVKENPYMSGQFLWTGIDYLGEAHGWPIHGAAAGLIDLAGFKKHRFFARKSYWCDTPVLELVTRIAENIENEWLACEKNWNYEDQEEVLVKVFSNLPEVALYLNGKEIARQKGYNGDGSYQFIVTYEAGELLAVGLDESGKELLRQSIHTTKRASFVKVALWENEADEQNRKNMGYLYQIGLKLYDKEKHEVVWDDHMVQVTVSGAGKLKGLENGNLADNTPYFSSSRKTYRGNLLVYVERCNEGSIRIEADVNGLDEGKAEISLD